MFSCDATVPIDCACTVPLPSHQPRSDAECVRHSAFLDAQIDAPLPPARRTELAIESFNTGLDCRRNGNARLAETNFLRVQALILEQRPTDTKDSLEAFAIVAASHNYLGIQQLDEGRPMEARPWFDRAIEIRRELLRLFPDDRENEVHLGGTLCNRAHAVADADPSAAIDLYRQSLALLRQPTRSCECSYWDEARGSWWCAQLEALGSALGLQWVALAPQFIDNAMRGLRSSAVGAAGG